MSDRAKAKGRMALYSMAGVYLLWQAYYLFKGLPRCEGSELIIMTIATIAFVLIGGVMVIVGVYKGSKLLKEDREAMKKVILAEQEKKKTSLSERAKGIEASEESEETAISEELDSVGGKEVSETKEK